MTTPLTRTDTIDGADLFTIYKNNQGDFRGFSYTDLITALTPVLTPTNVVEKPNSIYASPSSTGFSVNAYDTTDLDADVHLILTPLAAYAAGTIVLPPFATVADKQTVLVTCLRAVTVVTVDVNGAVAANGAPTTLVANDYFSMKYDAFTSSWYRVG